MFGKKKAKEKQENALTSVSKTVHNGSNFSSTTTTVTYRQVSGASKTTKTMMSGSSLPSLSNQENLILDKKSKRPSFLADALAITQTDAKPLTVTTPIKINLNYESPYQRTSPVYRSFGSSPITNRLPSTNLATKSIAPPARISPSPPKPPVVAPLQPKSGKQPPKKIQVKKTGKRYDSVATHVPVYKTSSKKRGELLVINNIMFKSNDVYRHGAEADDANVAELFKQMGFTVKSKRNLKKADMESAIRSFSRSSSLKSVDIAVVIVMSHGTNRETLGGYTEVIGVDEKGLLTDSVLEHFSAEKCPQMANKPKIFIFQCCRGDNKEFVQSDATPVRPKTHGDMLVAYSTLPGFVSHRDPVNGTWYIQTICDVFSEHAHEYHVEEMLKIVDERLANFNRSIRQTSSYESRGFKRCYFHP